jgi:hypothetical protein
MNDMLEMNRLERKKSLLLLGLISSRSLLSPLSLLSCGHRVSDPLSRHKLAPGQVSIDQSDSK